MAVPVAPLQPASIIRTMLRRTALPLAVVVAVALLGPSLAAAAPPSAWAKAADALCVKANADVRKLPAPKTAKEEIAAIEKSIAISDRLARALAKLSRPAAEAAEIAKLIGVHRQTIAYLRNVVKALRANDPARADKEMARANVLGRSFSISATKLNALRCAH